MKEKGGDLSTKPHISMDNVERLRKRTQLITEKRMLSHEKHKMQIEEIDHFTLQNNPE
jgi:hypothetical protein